MRRNLHLGSIFLAILVALGVGSAMLSKRATAQAASVCCGRIGMPF